MCHKNVLFFLFHQVNTFGGQIMAWMVNVATIAARYRLKAIHVYTQCA